MATDINGYFSNFTITEGIDIVPTAIVSLNTNTDLGFFGTYEEVELNGYKGYINEVRNRSLFIRLVDPKIYQVIDSKYLGNSLRNAINFLNLKKLEGNFTTDINQDFYMVNESPWNTFIRLSRYLPVGYHMACLSDKVKIFKDPNPGSFIDPAISTYVAESTYNRITTNISRLIKDSSKNGNPGYSDKVNIPISEMMMSDIVNKSGVDLINNYSQNYLNRDAFYPENVMFNSKSVAFEVGQGLIIGNVNMMVIARSMSFDSAGMVSGAYRCIKVS